MEADLARFYGADLRDHWRGDLTLRRLFALIRHLPPESAVATLERKGAAHWSIEAQLLDDLRMVLTGTSKKPGKPHPDRPKRSRARKPPDPRKIAAARRRAQERRRAKEAGEL